MNWGIENFRVSLMKGAGRRRHGEPSVYLYLKKLQRIHIYLLVGKKTYIQPGKYLDRVKLPLHPYLPPSSESFPFNGAFLPNICAHRHL